MAIISSSKSRIFAALRTAACLLVLLVAGVSAHAQRSSGLGVALPVTLESGLGYFGNTSGSVGKRYVNGVGLTVVAGLEWGKCWCMVGLHGEGQQLGQMSEASEFRDTNVSGLGYGAGPGVAFSRGRAALSLAYIGYGAFLFSTKTSQDLATRLEDPQGLRLGLVFLWKPWLGLQLSYGQVAYRTAYTGSRKSDLSEDRFELQSLALGIRFRPGSWKGGRSSP